jgi:threonylcarbamoyladenosine tRNA methylthiotransferase MtaB
VPWPVRKERGRVLKEIAQRKNIEFRKKMIGRTLSGVTLHDGAALTSNYLNVELSSPRPAKQIVDLTVGALSASGLKEFAPLAVLT